MVTTKRSYSPTIDDIRQYNIKRQHLLSSLETLSLSPDQHQQHRNSSSPKAFSNRHTEYIPDIEDFLINNQDDQDIIDASHHIELDTSDTARWIIPNTITKIPELDSRDVKFSLDRLQSRKKFELQYNKFNGRDHTPGHLDITNDQILYDYETLRYWSLTGYIPNPWLVVYKHWESWYFNVHKLDEMSEMMREDKIEMLPDDYQGPVDISNDEIHDDYNDVMIDDEVEGDVSKERDGLLKNSYGGYYANSSFDTSIQDDDAMDID